MQWRNRGLSGGIFKMRSGLCNNCITDESAPARAPQTGCRDFCGCRTLMLA